MIIKVLALGSLLAACSAALTSCASDPDPYPYFGSDIDNPKYYVPKELHRKR